ncbi:MAG: cardiolipin synthase [Marinovum algicola]|uniref:Cardiolipin synthase n=1 Tax=Marinovum algicola TaxID=42444 RepID=A0A975W684_9RHOB|nr:cardiolipin synthase [Marinovum algicola]SEI49987.1 cardiolipin synthase [Marinovum algicola]SLN30999.1 Cardiolipin synthase [Marinovum algicola]
MILNTLLVLHGLIVLSFTIRILVRDDLTPPARLAWFIALILLPLAGSAAYFLFGEVDLGHRARKRHREIFALIRTRAARFMGMPDGVAQLIERDYQPAFAYAASINGFYPVPGNRAALMADSSDYLDRLIADIDAATDTVHVMSYIWLEDYTGRAIGRALMRAARRGVTCRAIADGLGARLMIKGPLWQEMKEAGVELAIAFPFSNVLRTLATSRIDLRNHRKISVIDGRITYCGSQNTADPEFRIKARFAPWVDIMLRLTGPVVDQNQLLFASDWMQATGEVLDELQLVAERHDDGFAAQVIGDGPTERHGATPQLFSGLLGCAREQIVLTTPYFVPDTTVLEALLAAALRGVRVVLIFPRRNDSWFVAAASRSYYHRLLDAGCEIFEYCDGLLHAKTLTIDGCVSLIGSSNLDLRSFDLNYENNILLQDRAITRQIHARQQSYLPRSRPVTLDEVLLWPYLRRIWNNMAATIGPIL